MPISRNMLSRFFRIEELEGTQRIQHTLYDKITAIRAEKDNALVFCFKDGSETVKRWQDRSRAESWTEEMKDAAR